MHTLDEHIRSFSIDHNNNFYKVHHSRNDNNITYLKIENVLTGECIETPIINYSEDSGNEHLVDSLEHAAAKAYVEKALDVMTKMFGEL